MSGRDCLLKVSPARLLACRDVFRMLLRGALNVELTTLYVKYNHLATGKAMRTERACDAKKETMQGRCHHKSKDKQLTPSVPMKHVTAL